MERSEDEVESAPESVAKPVPIPHERIDPDALKVIHRLSRHGHLAYLVGGCVRDLLLDFTPKDFDVATSAWPGEIKDLFRNCRIIGRRFRLAHILFSGKFIEVSTFRGNSAEAGPGPSEDLLIREDNVFGTPKEDALRRDFTLNALFYDVERNEIIDYVGGLEDLRTKLVRCIGDPQIRFREDPVRILRALRFATRLGFELEPDIHQAMADARADLVKSAPPRLHEELLKTLASGASAKAIELLYETGVMAVLLPGISDVVSDVRPSLFSYLTALDQMDLGRRQVPDSVLLSALLYPIYQTQTGGQEDAYSWLEDVRTRSPLLMSTKRKDVDRILQMFRAQRRFARQGRGRRFSLTAFLRKDYFQDAWMLFRLADLVTGENRDVVNEWEMRLASLAGGRPALAAQHPSGGLAPGHGERPPPRGRRRRRRFRRELPAERPPTRQM